MADPDPEAVSAEGAAEGLILVSVLCVAGLGHVFLWMSSCCIWPARAASYGPLTLRNWFYLGGLIVVALDLFALVATIIRLARSPRAPSLRWVFGAGFLAMALAMAVAALVAHDRITLRTYGIVMKSSEPAIAAAGVLLACGVFGLILASVAGLLTRPGGPDLAGRSGAAGVVLLSIGCMLLVGLTTGWFAWVGGLSGRVPTDAFRIAPVCLAVCAGAAVVVMAALPRLPAATRVATEWARNTLPIVGLGGLVLLAPALWALAKDFTVSFVAGGVLTVYVPVFLVAHLLEASRPFKASDHYHTLRKLGLLVLTLGAFGFAITLFRWWSELGGLGPRDRSFVWLRTGAVILQWTTIAFLVLITLGAVTEFVRRRPNSGQTTPAPLVEMP